MSGLLAKLIFFSFREILREEKMFVRKIIDWFPFW